MMSEGIVLVDKLYLSPGFLGNITKEQLIAIHQTTRLAMKIRFFREALLQTKTISQPLYKVLMLFEGCGNLASVLNECIHRFYFPNKKQRLVTFDELKGLGLAGKTLGELESFRERREKWESDGTFRVYEYMRNNVGFHFHEDYFDGFIIDGEPNKPQLLAVQTTDKSFSAFFPFTYDLLVNKINGNPKSPKDGREIMEWFIKKVQEEAGEFQDLLQKAVLEVVQPGEIVHQGVNLWEDEY